MGYAGRKYRVTAITLNKTKRLGVYNSVSSVDKLIKEAKKLKKQFPFTGKNYLKIEVIKGRKVLAVRKIKI